MFEGDVALPAGELPVVVGSGGGLRGDTLLRGPTSGPWKVARLLLSAASLLAEAAMGAAMEGYSLQAGDGGSGGGAGGAGLPMYGNVIGRPYGGPGGK